MSENIKKPSYKEIGKHFTNFDTYSKVLKENYMFHKNMSERLTNFLKKRFPNKPFDFLDVGCGDASYISKVLTDTKINSYTALEVSPETIEKAKQNLDKVNCSKSFITHDASTKFPELDKQFDVIWSSYALHHFNQKEKESFFEQCLSHLKRSGFLIIVDLINNDYPNREECITNLQKYWEDNWTNLNQNDLNFLVEHVRSSDYPETVDKLFEIAKHAGFKDSDLDSKIDHYAFMIFRG